MQRSAQRDGRHREALSARSRAALSMSGCPPRYFCGRPSVKTVAPRWRSISLALSSFSSSLICIDSAGWLTEHSSGGTSRHENGFFELVHRHRAAGAEGPSFSIRR